MRSGRQKWAIVAALCVWPTSCTTCLAQNALPLAPPLPNPAKTSQAPGRANSVLVPQQILRSGININSHGISANTSQLAAELNLLSPLKRMQELRRKIGQQAGAATIESLSDRQELLELNQKVQNILVQTALEIDFVLAEIDAEQNLYSEVLSSFQTSRDKLVARINAGSFILNGALWAVCESLAIPAAKYPGYAVQSGIVGIAAGIVPSIASGYALKAYSGKHKRSEVEPNMLAKIFDRPINEDIDYPRAVWTFLNSVPASEATTRTRKEQLIDRWVSDKNIPSFTDKASAKEIDIITATVSQKKGLSIDYLTVRQTMLEQLQGEVAKMKRMLMEIAMVMTGEKEV